MVHAHASARRERGHRERGILRERGIRGGAPSSAAVADALSAAAAAAAATLLREARVLLSHRTFEIFARDFLRLRELALIRRLRVDQRAARAILLGGASARARLLGGLRVVPSRRLRRLRLTTGARGEVLALELLKTAHAGAGVVVAHARGEGRAEGRGVGEVVFAATRPRLAARGNRREVGDGRSATSAGGVNGRGMVGGREREGADGRWEWRRRRVEGARGGAFYIGIGGGGCIGACRRAPGAPFGSRRRCG